ncbi:hypothetical protein J11TS1_12850 [Oceanobacillus sp. J11TS1]|nr:hypothetical protein J11TS1_12850 [Oceanobacillus sp. J11TS1]
MKNTNDFDIRPIIDEILEYAKKKKNYNYLQLFIKHFIADSNSRPYCIYNIYIFFECKSNLM